MDFMQVELARKIAFSAVHFYSSPQFSVEENREHFGACFHPYGHGHNYVLEVFFRGPIAPESGLIVELRQLDEWLQTICAPLRDKHLNFEVSEFSELVPTTENIALWIHERILSTTPLSSSLEYSRLVLHENSDIFVELHRQPMTSLEAGLSLLFDLRACHRLKPYGGICDRLHGHDYKIEVTLADSIDLQTGLIAERSKVYRDIHQLIIEPFDGKVLNDFFSNTAGEALAAEFYGILNNSYLGSCIKKVAIQETRKNRFECVGDSAWL